MSGLAIGTAVAMLTVYATALFLALQQVADRFSPHFIPIIFRQRRVLVSLAGLVLLLIIAGVLAFTSGSTPIAIITFGVLLSTVILALVASYRTLVLVANGTRIVGWIQQTQDRDAALQDVLWKAIGRADHRVVAKALQAGLAPNAAGAGDLMDWLATHRDLLATDWLAREILAALLTATDADSDAITRRFDVICSLLREALAAESFPLARDVVDESMKMLANARPWTSQHAQLMYDLGFTVWNIGERGAFFEPRTCRVASQLADTKDLFFGNLSWIWRHLLEISDTKAVSVYGTELCTLGSDIQDQDARESILARVFNLMADGFERHLLTRRGIEVIVSYLGHMRFGLPEGKNDDKKADEHYQQWIDSHVVTLAAIYLELPPVKEDDDIDDEDSASEEDEQVMEIPVEVLLDDVPLTESRRRRTPQEAEDDAVDHLLGNGYIRARHKPGDKIVCYKQDWLKPESYQRVARLLGVKDFAR